MIDIFSESPSDGQSNKAGEEEDFKGTFLIDIFLGNALTYPYPLIHNQPNWTLDSEEFRSQTTGNSSVQNLLDSKNHSSDDLSWRTIFSFCSFQ